MNLNRSFQVVSRLLALVGLLSLVQTGEIAPFFSFVGLAAVLGSLALVNRKSPFIPGRGIWTVLNILVLSYFLFDWLLFSQSLLVASTHFIIFLMINKLFNLRSPQDHLQLYLISLLQLLAASTFTINFSFLAVFVLYLLVSTWALLLHHLVTENRGFNGEAVPGPNRTGTPPGISWPFFFNTNLIALVALCCTIVIFVSLPRISMGFFHQAKKNLMRLPGFSSIVNLGTIGEVKEDYGVVMRVKPSRIIEPGEGIYWRGMTFDAYDGLSWTDSFLKGDVITARDTGVFLLEGISKPGRLLTQEIILEPVDAAVIFGASKPVQIKGRFGGIRTDRMGGLSFLSVPATRVDYTVVSEIPILSVQDTLVEKIPLPPLMEKTYLQLPENVDRIRKLALEVTVASRTVFQKAEAIERFLKDNYRYTLNVKPSLFDSPVDDFLFIQKAGFCEHYATSMVLMLRAVGVPARLVTGFLPGEWNDIGEHYTVRQNDSHAWVEVFFPFAGWYPFDPTPAGNGEGDPGFALFTFVSRLFDSLQWKWNRYVVSFSFRDQINMATEFKGEVTSLRVWAADRGSFFLENLLEKFVGLFGHPLVNFFLLGAAGGIGFFLFRRLGWKFTRAGFPFWRWSRVSGEKKAVRFYSRMLEIFRKKGLPKPDYLTPREFIEGIPLPAPLPPDGKEISWFEAASEITRLYYRVRYAGIPLSGSEERRVENLLGNLKQALTLP